MNQEWTSKIIRKMRGQYKLTQRELAEQIGCRAQTISDWELGRHAPGNAYNKLLGTVFSQLKKEEKGNGNN